MEITITESNIDDFISPLPSKRRVKDKKTKETFNNIIGIIWNINELDESIIKKFSQYARIRLSS
jgi:hypothetical protein